VGASGVNGIGQEVGKHLAHFALNGDHATGAAGAVTIGIETASL